MIKYVFSMVGLAYVTGAGVSSLSAVFYGSFASLSSGAFVADLSSQPGRFEVDLFRQYSPVKGGSSSVGRGAERLAS